MSYITPTEVIQAPGMLAELAELFEVAQDLMAATIAGGDRSAWTAEEIADADTALAELLALCERADGEIDFYLQQRGYDIPLSKARFPILATWAFKVLRYQIQPQRDRTNEETGRIERDYRMAIRSLEQVAAGKLTLGANDPYGQSAAGAGMPQVAAGTPVFDGDSLADF